MKSFIAIVLVAVLAGCAPVYYAPAPYYAPAIQMYTPQPPIYVPTCGWVDQWDPVYYAWRRIQVCR